MTSCTLLPALAGLGSLALASFAPAEGATVPSATRPDGTPNRAVWMARGTFGVMTHYLIKPEGATPEERTAELNRIVDNFDVHRYVKRIRETGADWVIFTLGQTTGYLCAPNEYLDSRAPGMTPRRDLVMELAKHLDDAGKRLILYIPSEQNSEAAIQAALDSASPGYADRYFEFLKTYAVKYGDLVDGWWFDSCGPHEDEYWLRWLTALRAGNPDTAVAFSGAEFCCGGPVNPVCKLEDYHAGEIHLLEDGAIRRDFLPPGGDIIVTPERKLRLRGQEARTYMPDGQFIDGVQWHGLLPLDLTFNPAVPNQFCHYTDRELLAFALAVKSVGGAITINVPIEFETGEIPEDSHASLVRLGRNLREAAKHGGKGQGNRVLTPWGT
ncbi:MAG TPA: hypothetical protein PLD23_00605 [Armatimonadota bacterium]|nr:hypothetical protein [Armatimonadota bacterium]HQK91970.1 hypothetical protein [Armatimonadota bacterium]